MYTINCTVVYEGDGGSHTYKFTYLAYSLCDGLNILRESISITEAKNCWMATDVQVKCEATKQEK
jgi:hypothetical protein